MTLHLSVWKESQDRFPFPNLELKGQLSLYLQFQEIS